MTIIETATLLVETGKYRKAYSLIRDLLANEDPRALYLFATFRVDPDETLAQFEERRFNLIKRASELGLAEAQYSYGLFYEAGDGVEPNTRTASTLFKLAALGGHARAKLSYGLDLFYGSNGIEQDITLGINMIKQAAEEGVESADDVLKEIAG